MSTSEHPPDEESILMRRMKEEYARQIALEELGEQDNIRFVTQDPTLIEEIIPHEFVSDPSSGQLLADARTGKPLQKIKQPYEPIAMMLRLSNDHRSRTGNTTEKIANLRKLQKNIMLEFYEATAPRSDQDTTLYMMLDAIRYHVDIAIEDNIGGFRMKSLRRREIELTEQSKRKPGFWGRFK